MQIWQDLGFFCEAPRVSQAIFSTTIHFGWGGGGGAAGFATPCVGTEAESLDVKVGKPLKSLSSAHEKESEKCS